MLLETGKYFFVCLFGSKFKCIKHKGYQGFQPRYDGEISHFPQTREINFDISSGAPPIFLLMHELHHHMNFLSGNVPIQNREQEADRCGWVVQKMIEENGIDILARFQAWIEYDDDESREEDDNGTS